MKKWQLKHFIISGIFAAVAFAVAFTLGLGIIVATGIPATGGIANIIATTLVLIIGVKIVPRFGFSTLTLGLMFTMAIPTVTGGPPGVYKIINGILIGLTADIVLALGKRNNLSHILGGSMAAVVSILSIYAAMVILQLPAANLLRPLLPVLTIVQAVMGALGAWAGLTIFNKRLKNIRFIQQFMAENDEVA
jgi:hypothetical protein